MARHLTKDEIIRQCKYVAREKRMAERSPLTAAPIILCYSLYKSYDFKGQRLNRICQTVNDYMNDFYEGKIDVKTYSDDLKEKIGFTIDWEPYKESDIKHKKGSYEYWIAAREIPAQNKINEYATTYMVFFFTALQEIYGFGPKRCENVKNTMQKYLELYQNDRCTVRDWRKELIDFAGIAFEDPVDPLTQTSGSTMTGC